MTDKPEKPIDRMVRNIAGQVMNEVKQMLADGKDADVRKERVTLLHDHYKDTFTIVYKHWEARNRAFIYVLGLLSLMIWEAYDQGASKMLNSYVKVSTSSDPIDYSVIGSTAWALLLCLVVQYFQKSILVERQYVYLSYLETQMNAALGMALVTRESKSYDSSTGGPPYDDGRPFILKFIGFLYLGAFPLLLFGVLVYLISHELPKPFSATAFLNCLCAIIIGLMNFIYVTRNFIVWCNRNGRLLGKKTA